MISTVKRRKKKGLQTLQPIDEDGPLDDSDALPESLLLDFAITRLLAHSYEGGHVLSTPHAKFFENGQEVDQRRLAGGEDGFERVVITVTDGCGCGYGYRCRCNFGMRGSIRHRGAVLGRFWTADRRRTRCRTTLCRLLRGRGLGSGVGVRRARSRRRRGGLQWRA
jgi:hypothetical protein